MKDMYKPLVSIIVITYQSSRYVIETLESIKNQTWDNIELIISDDGSTDSTISLCTEWIAVNKDRFIRTKLLTVPHNTGIIHNVRRGVKAAEGDWIKSIAGDDMLMRNCINDNIQYAKENNDVYFIISDLIEIDEHSNLIREKVLNEGLRYFVNKKTKKEQLKAYSRWPIFLNTPTFFLKKEIITDDLFDNDGFYIFEDTIMIFKVINHDVKIHYFNKPTVKYRIHKNAISRNRVVEEKRDKELYGIYKKYRRCNLSIFNPYDVSVLYETWLYNKYKGFRGRKGLRLLRKLSLFYWYMRFQNIKSY